MDDPAVQSRKYHRRKVKQHDALAWSVKKTSRKMEAQKISNTWNCFLNVLYFIILGQGGNNLVEVNWAIKVIPEDNEGNCSSMEESNDE